MRVIAELNHQVAELSGVAAELAELAIVNQVDQLTHQVDDVTTDQLMTTPYSGIPHNTKALIAVLLIELSSIAWQ